MHSIKTDRLLTSLSDSVHEVRIIMEVVTRVTAVTLTNVSLIDD